MGPAGFHGSRDFVEFVKNEAIRKNKNRNASSAPKFGRPAGAQNMLEWQLAWRHSCTPKLRSSALCTGAIRPASADLRRAICSRQVGREK